MGWESPLQRARAALGMTQEQAANDAGISVQVWRAAEKNHRRPFLTNRYRIARLIAGRRNADLADGEPRFTVEQVIEELWS
jgi:DNA-binding XRE family transcriptional regulator